MAAVQKRPSGPIRSTFAERLEYARDLQRVRGAWREDQEMAAALGVSKASISEYKRSETAPPVERSLSIAQWVGVDPGWLAFGEDSAAPAPAGFSEWLVARRAARPSVRDVPIEAMERVTSKKPAPRKRANDR